MIEELRKFDPDSQVTAMTAQLTQEYTIGEVINVHGFPMVIITEE